MWKALAAGAAVVVIAACTPTQQVQVTDISGAQAVPVEIVRDGLSPGEVAQVEKVLADAGYVPAGKGSDATSKAFVEFSVGEARTSESVVEVPQYEQRQELRFINGRQVVFTEEQFVGTENIYITTTLYPATTSLTVRGPDSTTTVRSVTTEGECGDPELLKPVLVDVLLSPEGGRQRQIEIEGC